MSVRGRTVKYLYDVGDGSGEDLKDINLPREVGGLLSGKIGKSVQHAHHNRLDVHGGLQLGAGLRLCRTGQVCVSNCVP
jgi:hypothetical protein